MSQTGPLKRSFDGDDGVAFVVCRICGDYLRVISGQHLSKHDNDRETYMEEYHLTPDELMAKDFRIIQSSSEWIAAVRKVYKKTARSLPDISKTTTHTYMSRVSGFSVIGIRLCVQRDLIRRKCESAAYGARRKSSTQYALCTKSICRDRKS